jgi:type II secretory pathway component PulC
VESVRGLAWRDAFAEPQQLLLGGCLLLLVLLIGWEVWVGINAALYQPPVTAAATVVAGEDNNPAERIAAANLFGQAPQNTASGNQLLPETNLQLTLRGVFTASDSNRASAIIETGDGRAQVIRVGIAVAPDTVLQQVYDNRVVLARHGALENLYFPAATDSDAGLPVSDSGSAPMENLSQPDTTDGAAGPTSEDLSADQKRANILKRLEELRQRSSR